MPFRRPTLSDLRLRARAIFASKLKGADGTLPKSNITVSSDVMAALVYGVFGYADWLARQALPNTADDWNYLLRWGSLFGLTPSSATVASGKALFTGTAGTGVPANTQLQDSDGNLYKTVSTTVLITGNTTISVAAVAGGAFGNLTAGAPLTMVTAISGVNGGAVVDGNGLSGGTDAETALAFGARIAGRVKNPPAGSGTVADYERWALSVPGVTRAKATGLERGPGSVNVRFVMDNNPGGIIPAGGDITAVANAITALKPLTDDLLVVTTLSTQTVNYILSASLVQDSVRPAIAQALAAMHARLVIGNGLSFQGQMIPAITSAATNLTGTFLLTPNADVAASPDVVLTLGTITYQ